MEDCATILQRDHDFKPHGNLGHSSSIHRMHVRIRSKNGSRRRPEQSIVYEDVFGGHAKYSLPSHTSVFSGTMQQLHCPASLQNYDDIFRMPASNSSIQASSLPAIDAHFVDCDLFGRLTGTRKRNVNVEYDDVFGGVSGISTGPEVLADLLLGVINSRQSSSKYEQKGLLPGKDMGKMRMSLSHKTASVEASFSSTVEPFDRGHEYLQEKHHRGKSKTLDMDGNYVRENCIKKEHTWSNSLFQDASVEFEDNVELAEAFQHQDKSKPWISVSDVELSTGPTAVAPPERPPPFPDSSLSTAPYTSVGTKMPLREVVDAVEAAELYNSQSEVWVKDASGIQTEETQDISMSTANVIMERESFEVNVIHDFKRTEIANIEMNGNENREKFPKESEAQESLWKESVDRDCNNCNETIEKSMIENRQPYMLESDNDRRRESEFRMSGVKSGEIGIIKQHENYPFEDFLVQKTEAEETNGKQGKDRQARKTLQQKEKQAEENQKNTVEQQKDAINAIMMGTHLPESRDKVEDSLKPNKEKNNSWRKNERRKTKIRMSGIENREIGIQEQEDDTLDDYLVKVSRVEEINGKQGKHRQERKEPKREKEAEENQKDAVEHQKHAVNDIMEGAHILELKDKEGRLKLDERNKENHNVWRKEERKETEIRMSEAENAEISIKELEEATFDNLTVQKTRVGERNEKQGQNGQENLDLQNEKEAEANQMDAVEHKKNAINGITEEAPILEMRHNILKADEINKMKDDDCRKEERNKTEIRISGVEEERQERKDLQREKEAEENGVEHQKDAINGILEGIPILELRHIKEAELKPRRHDKNGVEKTNEVQQRHQKERDKGTKQGFTTDGTVEKVSFHDIWKTVGRRNEEKKTNFREAQMKHTEEESNVKESGKFQVEKDSIYQRKSKEHGIDIRETEKMKREKEAWERYQKEKEEREREREREKDRITVEGFTQENRGRNAGEQAATERGAGKRGALGTEEWVVEGARERTVGEKYYSRKTTAQAQEKAAAVDITGTEAQGKAAAVDRANEEMQERSIVERVAREARARALRAALEKVNKEERQKSGENSATKAGETFTDKEDKQRQLVKGASFGGLQGFPFGSHKTVDMRPCSSSAIARSNSFEIQDIEEKPTEREKARWDRHQRIIERTVRALEEKKQRDLQSQQEQAERHRVAGAVDGDINRWVAGKEGNLRALLSTLHYILWQESGWQPVSLTDLLTAASVKKAYRKAALCVHPDKVQQKGATIQQKYIAEKVFDLLKEAWNRFSSDELV